MRSSRVLIPVVLVLSVAGLMCSKSGDSTGPFIGGGPGTVAGTVTDRNGTPISGVAVKVQGGQSTATGGDGSFTVPTASSGSSDRTVLELSKQGFFTTLLGFVPSTTAVTNLKAMMSSQQAIGTANASAGVNVSGGGVTLATGANSFVNDSGVVVSGNVTITVAVVDPADSNFGIAAPGGDLLGVDPSGGDGVLGSNGMVFIGAQTASGAGAQLGSGAAATVSIPAGEAPVGKIGGAVPPDSVGLWQIGPDGIWVRTGTAYLSGSRYMFTTTKLGVFNCGRLAQRALVRGTLCGPGLSSGGETVRIGLLSTETDAGGRFAIKVPANDTLLARTRFGSAVIGPFAPNTTNTITLDFCDTVRVRITSPVNGSTVTTSPIPVTGTVSDLTLTSGVLIVNGSPQALQISNGAFAGSASLVAGSNLIRVEVLRPGRTTVADQVVVNYVSGTQDSTFIRWNIGATQYNLTASSAIPPFAVYDTSLQQMVVYAQDAVGLYLGLQPVRGTGTFSLGDFLADTTSWAIFDSDTLLGTPGTEYVTWPNLTGRATITSLVPGSVAPGTVTGTFSFDAGLYDSLLAGAPEVPTVSVTNGSFSVLLYVTGSTGKPAGTAAGRGRSLDPSGILREVNRLKR